MLYEHEGPGGLLLAHHVRSESDFRAAAYAQTAAVQSARRFVLRCVPFGSNPDATRLAVGDELREFPRGIRDWRGCVFNHEYSVGVAHMGHCGATSGEGDCVHGDSGGWNSTALQINSVVQCADRCRRCARCRFVSFSQFHEDCSWYVHCNVMSLRWAGYSYRTLTRAGSAWQPPVTPSRW